MTIETEKTKLISDTTIIKDIRDTQIEIDGFALIMQGFAKLARVDPNDSRLRQSMQNAEVEMNKRVEFVTKLKALLEERGVPFYDGREE